jgi:hypothetical protein
VCVSCKKHKKETCSIYIQITVGQSLQRGAHNGLRVEGLWGNYLKIFGDIKVMFISTLVRYRDNFAEISLKNYMTVLGDPSLKL